MYRWKWKGRFEGLGIEICVIDVGIEYNTQLFTFYCSSRLILLLVLRYKVAGLSVQAPAFLSMRYRLFSFVSWLSTLAYKVVRDDIHVFS